jgi:hypothetical protein
MVRNDRIVMNVANHEQINVLFTTENYSFFEEVSYFNNNTLVRNFYLYTSFSGSVVILIRVAC